MTPPKLGDILIKQGYLDQQKLEAALADQQAFGGKLGRTMVDLGYITDEELMLALAQQLELTTVDLDTAEFSADALGCLPVDACERYGVVPLRVEREKRLLWVATAEPDRRTLQDVARLAQLTVEPILAPMTAIDRAIRRAYYGDATSDRQISGSPLASIPRGPDSQPIFRGGAPEAPVPARREPEPAPLSAIPPGPPTSDDVAEMRILLLRIERTVAAQGRAFRALIELLQEKGVVRRGELGSRTAQK
jgi:hypothetical protein